MAKSVFTALILRTSIGFIPLFILLALLTVLVGHCVRSPLIGFLSSPDGQYKIYLLDMNTNLRTKVGHTPNVDVFVRSPDGQQIAFIVSDILYGNADAVPPIEVQFYVMNMDGGNLRELIKFLGQMSAAPSWSPDGSQIAFSANRYGQSDIYLLNVRTGAEQQITQNSGDNYEPVWSPDGTQIAFVSKSSGRSAIYVLDISAGTPEKRVVDDTNGEPPVWSPDGQHIAFVSHALDAAEIYVVDSSGENVRQLTTNTIQDYAPVWSPDGQYIAFQSQQDGARYQINVMSGDGSHQRHLVQSNGAILEYLVWSPDSRHIAYTADRDQNQTTEIMSVSIDDSSERLLSSAIFSSRWPLWWPR